MQVYAKTKYPEIYRETYWGAFKDTDELIKEYHIKHRNEFVEEFDIKEVMETGANHFPFHSGCEIDHIELYKAKDGRVIMICSNYNSGPSIPMIGYKPLYNTGAVTYIRIFKDKHEYNRAMKECGRV